MLAGFVTSVEPQRREEVTSRILEIEEYFDIKVEILTFKNWIKKQFYRAVEDSTVTQQELAKAWITAYIESLAQQRQDIAPIDEPCYQWLSTLNSILQTS